MALSGNLKDCLERFHFGDNTTLISANFPGCSKMLFTLWEVPNPAIIIY